MFGRNPCAKAALAALLGLAPPQALAATCDEPKPDSDGVRAAVVTSAAPRTYFVEGAAHAPECPSAADACRAKAYLTAGDIVVVTTLAGPFACATYISAKGTQTTNWLPASALSDQAPAAPTAGRWIGDWNRVEAHINVAGSTPGTLVVKGDATWGAYDPERVRRGGVNIGELDGATAPAGDTLAFTEEADRTLPFDQGDPDDCRVRMRLVGPYLVVADNNGCGGANVSFSGVYRRGG